MLTVKDPVPTPRGGHVRLDNDDNPFAGPGAKGAFAMAAIEARAETAKKLMEDAKADADEKDKCTDQQPVDNSEAVEALAKKIREDAQTDADARAKAEGDNPETPWTEGGPFDPASMALNNDLAENLIEDAQESADEKDGTDPIDPPPEEFIPVVVSVTSFTATNPAVATTATGGLVDGDRIRFSGAVGDPAAVAAVEGFLATISAASISGFTADGLDLSLVDVTGLTATGTTEEAGSAFSARKTKTKAPVPEHKKPVARKGRPA